MKNKITLIVLLSLFLISCSEKQNIKNNDINLLNKKTVEKSQIKTLDKSVDLDNIKDIKSEEELKKEEMQKENELLKKEELKKEKLQKNDEWLEKKVRKEA